MTIFRHLTHPVPSLPCKLLIPELDSHLAKANRSSAPSRSWLGLDLCERPDKAAGVAMVSAGRRGGTFQSVQAAVRLRPKPASIPRQKLRKSALRRRGVAVMRASTSASQASGSTSLSFAVRIMVVMIAVRSAPHSDLAKSRDFLLCKGVHKRKNWLFAGNDAGGETLAKAMTIIETAKLNGLDPQAYLADILARINDHKINRLDELLPWNWTPVASLQAKAAA